MKISHFFALTNKYWLALVQLTLTVPFKIPSTVIRVNFDLFLKMLDARSKQTFLVVFKIRFLFTFLFLPTCQYSLAEAEHPPVQTNALPLAVPEQTDCDFIAQGLMWYQNFAVPLKMLDTDK
jgi:hypothetical protein